MLEVQGLVLAAPAIGLAEGLEKTLAKDLGLTPAQFWILVLVGLAAFAAIRWIVSQPAQTDESRREQELNDAAAALGEQIYRGHLERLGITKEIRELERQHRKGEITQQQFNERKASVWKTAEEEERRKKAI